VVLAKASRNQLERSMMTLNFIAELRRPNETADFFDSLPSAEHSEWLDDLLERTSFTAAGSASTPHVCVLDTGVNRGHPLLEHALESADLHTVEPAWGVDDSHGHGTSMAGLALAGDLTDHLIGRHPLDIAHRLESVKLLPHDDANQGDPRASRLPDRRSHRPPGGVGTGTSTSVRHGHHGSRRPRSRTANGLVVGDRSDGGRRRPSGREAASAGGLGGQRRGPGGPRPLSGQQRQRRHPRPRPGVECADHRRLHGARRAQRVGVRVDTDSRSGRPEPLQHDLHCLGKGHTSEARSRAGGRERGQGLLERSELDASASACSRPTTSQSTGCSPPPTPPAPPLPWQDAPPPRSWRPTPISGPRP
jgi:hypothetical protein